MKKPYFTISLDFELFWGVYDTMKSSSYRDSILQGRQSIPMILSLFKNYNIHAPWATVGMLTFENKRELLNYLPTIKPKIHNRNLDPYYHLELVGNNEKEDPYHFGYSILNKILDGMEIGSHTFSHYNYLELGNSVAFKSDLESSNEAFRRLNLNTPTIVFCRNQYDETSFNVANECGFNCYRGNESSIFYKPRDKQNGPCRLFRLIDSYFNLSGDHLSNVTSNKTGLINIPSSRFLRLYNSNYLEDKKLRRIMSSMLEAAKKNQGYHLWWHPHNFGKNLLKNIASLKIILQHFRSLSEEYGMVSLNMKEIANKS